MKRVTIVGGGLAGLSLGVALLGKGVPVRICEAGRYPRHRVCGEFINGVSGETLERLGVESAFTGARKLRSTKWYHRGEPLYQTDLEVPARGISRYLLDEKLARLFTQSGGELETGRREVRSPGEGVVWAAGRRPERASRWLGLKVHVRDLAMSADLEMHLGRTGYVGLAPVEEERVNVCGLFRKEEPAGKGVEMLWKCLESNGLEELASRLRGGKADPASFLGVSAFRLGPQSVAADECVLGDAESMIPPFTGNGMSMAFEAADLATEPLVQFASGGFSWSTALAEVRARLRERFRRRLVAARMVHPLFFTDFGKMLLSASAHSGLLPFRPISRLLR